MKTELKKENLEIGVEFKSKSDYYSNCTFKIISISDRYIGLSLTDANKVITELQRKNLEQFLYDVNFGYFEIINKRPEVNKNNQLEDCGSYAD